MDLFPLAAAALAISPLASADIISLSATVDNCIYEEDEFLSNGEGDHFFSGNNMSGDTRRGVMMFDVAGSLPAGAIIQSASLKLYCSMTIASSHQVSLHRLTTSFGEGQSHAIMGEGGGAPHATNDATWAHTFWDIQTPQFWTTPGGDFIATPSSTLTVSGTGSYTWASANMADDVQAMLDDPANAVGWIVKHDNESGTQTAKRYDSRTNITTSRRPKLDIIYTAGLGTNFCSSLPNSVGAAGSTITAMGSVSHTANNLVVHADGLPASQPGLFYYGPATLGGIAFGNGLRCVAGGSGTVVRCLPTVMSDPAGEMTAVIDNTLGIHYQISAGATLHFQCWYRDPAAGGAGYNLSNGLSLLFTP